MALSEFPRLCFDPFVELRRMQSEMNRLFSGFTRTTRDFPPINIWLGDNSVVVTSELPGGDPQRRYDQPAGRRADPGGSKAPQAGAGCQLTTARTYLRQLLAYRPAAVPGRRGQGPGAIQ
jgi:hypothetical protein